MRVRLCLVVVALIAAWATVAPSPAAAVYPGSVSPFINNVPGNIDFSFGAVAAGWYKGNITVSYKMYWGASSSGPWTLYYTGSRTCSNTTSCATVTQFASCTGAWYKNVGYASGPGGSAENNGAAVIKYVYGSLGASPPAKSTTMTTASVAQMCKVKNDPI